MHVLNDIELDFLHKMLEVEWGFDSWSYGQRHGASSFNAVIDTLHYNLYYFHSGFQITIMDETRRSRLGIRLNDVAGWDEENKKVLYRNKVYAGSECLVVGKDEIEEEAYKLVLKVLEKLETHKDTWKLYYKDE